MDPLPFEFVIALLKQAFDGLRVVGDETGAWHDLDTDFIHRIHVTCGSTSWSNRRRNSAYAAVTDAVLPGVLYTPKGVWLSASPTGQTVNALLDADIRTDIEDGACCNEAFCEVARVALTN